MEEKLKEALGASQVKRTNIKGGGCISQGRAYETNNGMVFVKQNKDKDLALPMFEGEFEGLKAIAGTNTVKVPEPLLVLHDDGSGSPGLVMEYMDISALRSHANLGSLLAKLHLYNEKMRNEGSSSAHGKREENELEVTPFVDKFGFHATTYCGRIPLDNTWQSNWVEFFAQQRLKKQVDLIEEKYGDRQVVELWSQLQHKIPSFFEGITIYPSLLHGDLWCGNAGEVDGEPVIFDPASFYGHSEFELSIASMFGGFSAAFFAAYHTLIPKARGFDVRQDLYQLFHQLNHWNHFGGGYRGQSVYLMKKLIKQ